MPCNSFPLPSCTTHRMLHEHSQYGRCMGLDLLLAHPHRLTRALRATCNAEALTSTIARRNAAALGPGPL